MNQHFRQFYRLKVDPIAGLVTARRGTQILAQSSSARLMHETRLPQTIYFPRSDVIGLADQPSEKRTFCPFKGTAVYHDIDVAGEHFADAAWVYPRALPESQDIEGYVAFMPEIIDQYDAAEGFPAQTADGHISSPIVDWLLREAWNISDSATLTREIARRLVHEGIAVWRLNVTMWSLHPQIAGASYVWRRETDIVSVDTARHENLSSQAYVNSPIRYVSEGMGGVRQPLTLDEMEFDFPVMEDLKQQGATDYVAMPLPFSDGRINVMTMATDHPDGFTTANLGLVFECSAVLSRYFEVHSLRMSASTLLGTYLGKKTGARVLGGEIKRGDGDEIDAAILFCDLRGSSRLSEEMGTQDYLALLNRFFETVTSIIENHNGEVLKFIGDAVLAVFPVEEGDAVACSNAELASEAIAEAIQALNSDTDGIDVSCALGACFGRVTYGNVGSGDRLDFTVIGSAANIAARLSDLGKTLGQPILFSGEIASRVDRKLKPLGSHSLHNVNTPVEVFAPRAGLAIDR